jgi:hypothetical protein
MKSVLASMSAAAITLIWASAVQAQTADEIVEKHLAAAGGRAALSKLTSEVAAGTVAISAQGASLTGTIELTRKVPNKSRTLMRIDLSSVGGSEMTIDQRCDGKTAYTSNSMQGDREITGAQLQHMLNASFPSPFLTLKEAGAKVEVPGRDTIDGTPVLVMVYTPVSGPASKLLLDAETYLPVRQVVRLSVPEAGGEVEQTTDMADYRDVNGVKQAFAITVTAPGQIVKITLSKVEFNTPIDDAMFSRPAVK